MTSQSESGRSAAVNGKAETSPDQAADPLDDEHAWQEAGSKRAHNRTRKDAASLSAAHHHTLNGSSSSSISGRHNGYQHRHQVHQAAGSSYDRPRHPRGSNSGSAPRAPRMVSQDGSRAIDTGPSHARTPRAHQGREHQSHGSPHQGDGGAEGVATSGRAHSSGAARGARGISSDRPRYDSASTEPRSGPAHRRGGPGRGSSSQVTGQQRHGSRDPQHSDRRGSGYPAYGHLSTDGSARRDRQDANGRRTGAAASSRGHASRNGVRAVSDAGAVPSMGSPSAAPPAQAPAAGSTHGAAAATTTSASPEPFAAPRTAKSAWGVKQSFAAVLSSADRPADRPASTPSASHHGGMQTLGGVAGHLSGVRRPSSRSNAVEQSGEAVPPTSPTPGSAMASKAASNADVNDADSRQDASFALDVVSTVATAGTAVDEAPAGAAAANEAESSPRADWVYTMPDRETAATQATEEPASVPAEAAPAPTLETQPESVYNAAQQRPPDDQTESKVGDSEGQHAANTQAAERDRSISEASATLISGPTPSEAAVSKHARSCSHASSNSVQAPGTSAVATPMSNDASPAAPTAPVRPSAWAKPAASAWGAGNKHLIDNLRASTAVEQARGAQVRVSKIGGSKLPAAQHQRSRRPSQGSMITSSAPAPSSAPAQGHRTASPTPSSVASTHMEPPMLSVYLSACPPTTPTADSMAVQASDTPRPASLQDCAQASSTIAAQPEPPAVSAPMQTSQPTTPAAPSDLQPLEEGAAEGTNDRESHDAHEGAASIKAPSQASEPAAQDVPLPASTTRPGSHDEDPTEVLTKLCQPCQPASSVPTLPSDAFVPRGITNTGNFCFTSSVLQALLGSRAFCAFLRLLQRAAAVLDGDEVPTLAALAALADELEPLQVESDDDEDGSDSDQDASQAAKSRIAGRFRTGTTLKPFMMERVLARFNAAHAASGQGGGLGLDGLQEQQDSQEFFQFVVDEAHEDVRKLRRILGIHADSAGDPGGTEDDAWCEVGRRNKSSVVRGVARTAASEDTVVSAIFRGAFKSIIKGEGFPASVTVQPFSVLHLELKGGEDSVDRALKRYIQPETIEDYRFPNGSTGPVTKQVKMYQLPQVLVVHLMRFMYGDKGSVKLHQTVDFEPTLRLSKSMFADGAHVKSAEYKLYATVSHEGATPANGHYVADVLQPDEKWLHFNDTNVQPIPLRQVLSRGTYMLFYHRVA